jgi:hypothetical protein
MVDILTHGNNGKNKDYGMKNILIAVSISETPAFWYDPARRSVIIEVREPDDDFLIGLRGLIGESISIRQAPFDAQADKR